MRPSGDIFSPSYSISSSVSADCVWILSVYDEDKIAIGFNEFDLAVDVDCASEYVELRDGGSDDSPLLGRYCESAPMVVFGSTNKMWVRYYSVGTGRKGFEATWTTMKQTMKGGKPISPDVGDVRKTESLPYPPSKLHFYVKSYQCLFSHCHMRKLSCELGLRVKRFIKYGWVEKWLLSLGYRSIHNVIVQLTRLNFFRPIHENNEYQSFRSEFFTVDAICRCHGILMSYFRVAVNKGLAVRKTMIFMVQIRF